MTSTNLAPSLLVLTGTPLAPGKMYLRLYHGRTDPAQEMDGWGFAGRPSARFAATRRRTAAIFGFTPSMALTHSGYARTTTWSDGTVASMATWSYSSPVITTGA
jgi:hypothetical protein